MTVANAAWQALITDLSACLKYLDAEALAIRWTFAKSLQSAGNRPAITGLIESTPSLDDGKRVHAEIEGRFVRYHGPISERSHDVVVERDVHLKPAPGQKVALELAATYRPGMSIYPWLAVAFKTRPSGRTGNLRSDLIDVDEMRLWEVKALGSIDDAVLQVARYTTRYNCTSHIPLTRYTGSARPLTPGELIDPRVLTPFMLPLENSNAQPKLVVPFEIVPVPGIIGYLLIKLPRPADLVAATASAAALLRLYQEMRKRRFRISPSPAPSGVPEWVALLPIAIGIALIAGAALTSEVAVPATALGGSMVRGAAVLREILAGIGLILPAAAGAAEPPGRDVGHGAAAGPPVELPVATLLTGMGPISGETADAAIAGLALLATAFGAFSLPLQEP